MQKEYWRTCEQSAKYAKKDERYSKKYQCERKKNIEQTLGFVVKRIVTAE